MQTMAIFHARTCEGMMAMRSFTVTAISVAIIDLPNPASSAVVLVMTDSQQWGERAAGQLRKSMPCLNGGWEERTRSLLRSFLVTMPEGPSWRTGRGAPPSPA